MNGMIPQLVTDCFYDSCSAAWQKEDGTLDAEALGAFLNAMQAIYDLDAPMREQYSDYLKQLEAEGDNIYTPGDYTSISGARGIVMNGTALSA